MRHAVRIVILASSALLLALPLVAAGPGEGDLALTGGIPLRMAGDVAVEAQNGVLVLTEPPTGGLRMDYERATLRVITVSHQFSQLPTGDRVRVNADVIEQPPQALSAGYLRLDSIGENFYLIGEGHRVEMASRIATPGPADAWRMANVQFTSLLHPRVVEPPITQTVSDIVTGPESAIGSLQVTEGTYEARASHGTATVALDRLVLFDAVAVVQGSPVQSRLVAATAPGDVWVPTSGTWTGLGTHHVENVTFILLEPHGASLSLSASPRSPLYVYSDEARIRLDGYAQFPWATGQVQTETEAVRLDGDQVLLGGNLQLRPIGVDHEKAPSITYIGTGHLELLQVGPAPEGPTTADAVILAGGASLAAVALAATVWYWPLVKWGAGGLVAPLYARLPRDRVLDHRGRSLVYDLIRQEAGVSTHRLASSVEFGWSTLMYHLRVLERTEKIVSVRDGRYKRFFDRESGRYANGRKVVVAVLKNDSTLAIARMVLEGPGITQKELSERLHLAPSSIHWHVERLTDAGLLEKRRDGHNVRYYPGSAWKEVQPEDVGIPAVLLAPAIPIDNPLQAPAGAPMAPLAVATSLGRPQ